MESANLYYPLMAQVARVYRIRDHISAALTELKNPANPGEARQELSQAGDVLLAVAGDLEMFADGQRSKLIIGTAE